MDASLVGFSHRLSAVIIPLAFVNSRPAKSAEREHPGREHPGRGSGTVLAEWVLAPGVLAPGVLASWGSRPGGSRQMGFSPSGFSPSHPILTHTHPTETACQWVKPSVGACSVKDEGQHDARKVSTLPRLAGIAREDACRLKLRR